MCEQFGRIVRHRRAAQCPHMVGQVDDAFELAQDANGVAVDRLGALGRRALAILCLVDDDDRPALAEDAAVVGAVRAFVARHQVCPVADPPLGDLGVPAADHGSGANDQDVDGEDQVGSADRLNALAQARLVGEHGFGALGQPLAADGLEGHLGHVLDGNMEKSTSTLTG